MKVPRPLPLPAVAALLLLIFLLLGVLILVTFDLATRVGIRFEWTIFPILVILLFGSIGALAWKFGLARKLILKNQEAVVLLNLGRAGEAEAILDEVIRRAVGMRNLKALFLMNRSVAWLHQGRAEACLETAGPLLEAGWFEKSLATYHGPGVATVLTPLALLGRVEEAEVILGRELPRIPESQVGAVLPARLLLRLQREDFEGLLALEAQGRAAAEAILPARSLKMVRLLRAYALERSEPERVDEALAGLPLEELSGSGHLGYLPGVKAFLESRLAAEA